MKVINVKFAGLTGDNLPEAIVLLGTGFLDQQSETVELGLQIWKNVGPVTTFETFEFTHLKTLPVVTLLGPSEIDKEDIKYTDIEVADYDSDGDLDIYLTNNANVPLPATAGQFILFENTGSDTEFVIVDSALRPRANVLDIEVGDFNHDGLLDLLEVGVGYTAVSLGGTGMFNRLNTTGSSAGDLSDIDGDGDLDILLANLDGPNEIWYNDGAGNFNDMEFIPDVHQNGQSVDILSADFDIRPQSPILVRGYQGKFEPGDQE